MIYLLLKSLKSKLEKEYPRKNYLINFATLLLGIERKAKGKKYK
jgi:hypothetical protein